ncbi:hypothetical protein GF380_02795 [Candidatus Uhrbacteria bacterium]|nr:hypothetical protein [Candidatus Uhrbacteria bacterium]MBD3284080.1 hypothetical protein [Candidatus Uhrbacteria bacterium]
MGWAGAIAGFSAGAIMILLGHVAPLLGANRLAKDLDVLRLFGRKYSRRESHIVGMIIHLILYAFFGIVYGVAVVQGVFDGVQPFPLGIYLALITIVMGGVIMPLEGHGLFGVKEDHWFVVDLLLMNAGWLILFAAIFRIWL